MSKNSILTRYVSEIDQILQTFDQQNPMLSKSQEKEFLKHQRIGFLRDNTTEQQKNIPTLWEDF